MSIVTIDLETYPTDGWTPAPKPVCVGFKIDDQPAEVVTWADGKPLIDRWLEDSDILLVGAYVAFDLGCCAAQDARTLQRVFTAQAAQRVVDVQRREMLIAAATGIRQNDFRLEALAKRHLQIALDKGEDSWQLRFKELDGLPIFAYPSDALQYVLQDVETTYAVYQAQERYKHLMPQDRWQTAMHWWLWLSTAEGLRTDPTAVTQIRKGLEARMQAVLTTLKVEQLCTRTKDGTICLRQKEAKARVVANAKKLGINLARTEKGNIRLVEDALAPYDDPGLQAYREYNLARSFRNNVLQTLELGVDSPLHVRHILVSTGRESTRRNIQNIPRKGPYRRCFIPPPGWVWFAADYGGLELATFAQFCLDKLGHSRQAELLNQGKNLHSHFAAAVLGIDLKLFDKHRPDHKGAYHFAKIGGFGQQGCMVPETIVIHAKESFGTDMPITKARTLQDLWFQIDPARGGFFCWHSRQAGVWPEFLDAWGDPVKMLHQIPRGATHQGHSIHDTMAHYLRHIPKDPVLTQCLKLVKSVTKRVAPNGWVLKLDRVDHVRGRLNLNEACNFSFQCPAAYGAKAGGLEISRAMYLTEDSPLFGSRIVNFVHDELDGICPEMLGHGVVQEVSRIMVDNMKTYVPDVKIGVEAALMRRWDKRAEPVFKDGRLIPWEEPSK